MPVRALSRSFRAEGGGSRVGGNAPECAHVWRIIKGGMDVDLRVGAIVVTYVCEKCGALSMKRHGGIGPTK